MPSRQASGTETTLKRQVMKLLELEFPGAVVRKRHGSIYSTAGDPDLEILYRGVHIECELKRLGEEATPLQARRLEEWRKAGAICAVVHTVAETRALMHIVEDGVGRPAECPECMRAHRGSSNCRSGSLASGGTRAHCACDTCF
jgi:hypothetical protein